MAMKDDVYKELMPIFRQAWLQAERCEMAASRLLSTCPRHEREAARAIHRATNTAFKQAWEAVQSLSLFFQDQPLPMEARPQAYRERAQLIFESCRHYSARAEQEAAVFAESMPGDLQEEAYELREMAVELEVLAFRLSVRARSLIERAELQECGLDSRRCFNTSQKRELYERANGRCNLCDARLGDRWHADHIFPHSLGGRTQVENGQALCIACNMRKGSSVLTVDGGE